MLDKIIVTFCTLLMVVVGTLLTAAWWLQASYNTVEKECGTDLNKTCFVVIKK